MQSVYSKHTEVTKRTQQEAWHISAPAFLALSKLSSFYKKNNYFVLYSRDIPKSQLLIALKQLFYYIKEEGTGFLSLTVT
jgi:hypothetical protein